MTVYNLKGKYTVQSDDLGFFVWGYWFKSNPGAMVIDLRQVEFK